MANPFTVQPLGGLQSVANIQQGMQGIAQNFQADEAEERKRALMGQAAEVMERGNPQEIAKFSMQNPEIGEAMMGGIKFKDAATRENMKTSMQGIIAGRDPVQILQQRAEMVEARGGDASDTRRELEVLQEMGPEEYRKLVQNEYAMAFGDEGLPGTKGGPSIGTYNPRDYTTESFAEFTRTNDPSVLERYASQRTVDIGGVPHTFDPARGGYYPATISGQGQGKPVTAETVGEAEAERVTATETAKQDVKAKSPEERRKIKAEISERRKELANAQDVLTRVQSIEDNPGFIESVTGIRGKMPAIPGTEGFDAEIAFDQLRDTLTLGNLSKMSGVLSESDIRILSSAASGLEYGMSEDALKERLDEIRAVFEEKTQAERERISELMGGQSGQGAAGMSDDDADALINSILGQ